MKISGFLFKAAIVGVLIFALVFPANESQAGVMTRFIQYGVKLFSEEKPAIQTAKRLVTETGKKINWVSFRKLPAEAKETIQRIKRGGPHPFDRDGVEFKNYEKILPSKPPGYYTEYTVVTPGKSGRGSRRIVQGRDGEMYYTDDHYNSFKQIVE